MSEEDLRSPKVMSAFERLYGPYSKAEVGG
jgi:hypothetical protein